MTAGSGTPAEHSGLRETVAPVAPRANGARWWHRWRLVPFFVLILAVIAATIAGFIVRDRLDLSSTTAPTEAKTTGELVPAQCAPPLSPLPSTQPWIAQARTTSEQTFRLNNGGSLPVIEGRDGYVFWGDHEANNFSQAVGRRILSQEELDAWYLAMDSLRDRLAEHDIDFVIQVVPAKWSVLPDQLPAWTDNIIGSTTLDYVRYAHPDLPVMDMRPALREANEQENVYTPLNSHWTRFGGTVGWQSLAECLTAIDGDRYAGLEPLAISSFDPQSENNEYERFGFAVTGTNDPVPVWASAPAEMTLTLGDGATSSAPTDRAVDMLELPATTENPAAQSSATALIFRDSQGNSIAPGWQAGFATTWQYPHNLDKPDLAVNMLDLALELQPDVVILEITERHLNFVPPITY